MFPVIYYNMYCMTVSQQVYLWSVSVLGQNILHSSYSSADIRSLAAVVTVCVTLIP
jgi:hypothetical protein